MAKRPPTRSKATDPDAPAPPKTKRVRSATAIGPAPVAPPAEPTDDDIRRRAYERYQARGGNHGQHFNDWLEAEKELKRKK